MSGHTTAPDGGFAVEFSPDFSEGEGRWWVSRIGADQTRTQKGGTFYSSKKTALTHHSETAPAPREASHAMTTLVVALNLATIPVRLTDRGQRDEHIPRSSRGFSDKRLIRAGNLHRFNVVRHVQFGQVRNTLPRSEGDLRTFEVLNLVTVLTG
jgi:hypothetical protein